MKPGDAGPPRAGAKGSPVLAEISLLLAVFFVGMDVVSVKYALEGLPPLVFMPFRYVLAGLLLLAALRLVGRKVAIAPRDLPALAGLGLVGVGLNQVGYTAGLSLTSGSNASLVFATAPVWGPSWVSCWGWSAAPGQARSASPWPSRGWPSSWAVAWDPRMRPWGATCWCV